MNERFFTQKIFYRFFVPSLLASLCLAVANLADALSAGIALGENGLAAVALVAPIWMIFNVLDVGLGVGGALAFTRHLSEGHAKKAVAVFEQLFTCTLVLSLLLAVLGTVFLRPILLLLGTDPSWGAVYSLTRDYARWLLLTAPIFFLNILFYNFIRCDDGEKRASMGLAVANILDVSLSFVLVLGLDLGIKGAIWATILGTTAGIAIYLPHFFNKANILRLRLVKPDWKLIFPCFRTGFASSSQYLWQFFFFLVINNLLIRRHGEGGLAIFNVVINLSYIIMGLYEGVSATIHPLTATFHAERNQKAERTTLHMAFRWGTWLGAGLLSAMALLAPQLALAFGLPQTLVPAGALALRWYAVGAAVAGTSVMLCAYWQAVGREFETLLLTFLRTFGLYLPLAALLALGPLSRFWLVFPLTETASLLVLWAWRQVRYLRAPMFGSLDTAPICQRMIQDSTADLAALLEQTEAFCENQNASMSQSFFVNMAVEEMCQTIFSRSAASGRQDIYIQMTLFPLGDGQFELHLRDNAPAFDPFSLHTQRIGEAENEEAAMDSMGVLMVKKKAKECYYRHYQGFNTLTVRI